MEVSYVTINEFASMSGVPADLIQSGVDAGVLEVFEVDGLELLDLDALPDALQALVAQRQADRESGSEDAIVDDDGDESDDGESDDESDDNESDDDEIADSDDA